MQNRPAWLTVLAGLHILAPVFSLLGLAWIFHISPVFYTEYLYRLGKLELLKFFGLLPLAGFALLRVRAWSYPVFCLAVTMALVEHFQNLRSYPHYIPVGFVVGLGALNLAIAGYLLRRAVRRPFFEPALRWWESQRRYPVRLDCRWYINRDGSASPDAPGSSDAKDEVNAQVSKGEFEGVIRDISSGGVLLEVQEGFASEDPTRLRVRIQTGDFSARGELMHWRMLEENQGTNSDGSVKRIALGIRFKGLSWQERRGIRRLLGRLKRAGVTPKQSSAGTWLQRLASETCEIRDELFAFVHKVNPR
jgi:hypothetical protein